jgi:hypothetical protein
MNFILECGLKKVRRESESFFEKSRKISFQLRFIHPILGNVFSTPNHAAVNHESESGFLRK